MSPQDQSLVGSLALTYRYLHREQLEDALREQAEISAQGRRAPRLGEILVSKGYLTNEQLRSVLKGQKGKGSGLFGEIAENWALCSGEHIDAALAEQIEYRMQHRRPRRLGEILVARGAITVHQVHRVLAAQGKQIVDCPGCHTAYNALHLQRNASIVCPRCNTVFTPQPPPTESTANNEAIHDVHSDATALLPAYKEGGPDNETGQYVPTHPDIESTPYRLITRIGSDASGFIYKAVNSQTERNVALRVVSEVASEDGPDAWLQAATTASSLDHPHLQRVLDARLQQGRVLIASEYHEGQSLRHLLQSGGKLGVTEVLETMIQCAEALSYGLSRRLIHGDLRPSYILSGPSNRARIAGLGLPKRPLTNLKLITGSCGAAPLYAAPEVLRDISEASESSDVYSLCAIGYHLVTGRAPHIASMTHTGHLRSAPPKIMAPRQINPLLPTYLSRLLMKGLSRHPEDRYPSALELLHDLQTCLSAFANHLPDVPAVAPPSSGVRSRVARPHAQPVVHRRGKRRQTAWSSRLARLTLSDPPQQSATPAAGIPGPLPVRNTVAAGKPASVVDHPWALTGIVVALLAVAFAVLATAVRDNRPTHVPPPPGPSAPAPASTSTAPHTTATEPRASIAEMERALKDLHAYQTAHPERHDELLNRAEQFLKRYGTPHAGTAAVNEVQDLRRLLLQVKSPGTPAESRPATAAVPAEDRNKPTAGGADSAAATRTPEPGTTDPKLNPTGTTSTPDATKVSATEAEALALAQREATAQVLIRKLAAGLMEPVSRLDLRTAREALAAQASTLAGTPQAAQLTQLRQSLVRIERLVDRAAVAAKDGVLKGTNIQVRTVRGDIMDGSATGLVLQSGVVRATVEWAWLEPAALCDLLKRCTNAQNAEELADFGLFHLYLGNVVQANELFSAAEKRGGDVKGPREVAALIERVMAAGTTEETPEERQALLDRELASKKALVALGWEISRGNWSVSTSGILTGTPLPGMTLVSLRRDIAEFRSLEVECRGEGEVAGFSFGRDSRYLARPTPVWQRLSLHVLEQGQLEFRVDGEPRKSLEPAEQNEAALPEGLYLRGMGTKIEFRDFKIDGKPVNPQPNVAPSVKPAPKDGKTGTGQLVL